MNKRILTAFIHHLLHANTLFYPPTKETITLKFLLNKRLTSHI